MIEYISGKIAELTPTYAVIDNHGIGYELNISLTTYSELENKSEIKLLAHEVIREDAHIIFGFATKNERELFRLLIGVSGVGANTARMILSSITPPELEQVITSGDDKRLKGVKGVGVKTAQRIIVDLKDKIKPTEDTLFIVQSEATAQSAAYDEALAALVALEFPRAAAQKALRNIFKADPAITVEGAIKKAFAMM